MALRGSGWHSQAVTAQPGRQQWHGQAADGIVHQQQLCSLIPAEEGSDSTAS